MQKIFLKIKSWTSCLNCILNFLCQCFTLSGDLFERKEDIDNEYMWLCAGSEDMNLQKENRLKIINLADWIVPGHGEIFKVTEQIKTDMNKKNVQ